MKKIRELTMFTIQNPRIMNIAFILAMNFFSTKLLTKSNNLWLHVNEMVREHIVS